MLIAAVFVTWAAAAAPASPALYRIELAGNQTVWSEDRPVETGSVLVFHRYPGGVLVSVRKNDLRRLSRVAPGSSSVRPLRPGELVDVGSTSGGSGGGSGESRPTAARRDALGTLLPGEAKGGTALFNPDRAYRPEWDGRQAPGLNFPYPNSPNDYREGRTLAYPPAPAVQTDPGAPPKMPAGKGEVPH